jgi:hypothetical protein
MNWILKDSIKSINNTTVELFEDRNNQLLKIIVAVANVPIFASVSDGNYIAAKSAQNGLEYYAYKQSYIQGTLSFKLYAVNITTF